MYRLGSLRSYSSWKDNQQRIFYRPALGFVYIMQSIAIAMLLFLLTTLFLPIVFADGGAPNLAYVAGAGRTGNDLAVIDIGQQRVTASIAIGGHPAGVVLSTDGRNAYVTESSGNALAIVDANARKVIATLPLGKMPTAIVLNLAQTPNTLYIADSGSNSVTVVDPTAQRVEATISVGSDPTGLAVALPGTGIVEADPHNAEIYVANSASDTVSVISAASHRVIATIPVPGGPLSITIPQTGGVAYVSTRAGAVFALSLATHQVAGLVLNNTVGPLGIMDYDAVTGQVYVPLPNANAVDILAPVAVNAQGKLVSLPAEPAHVLAISGMPVAVAITFEGSYGFVAQSSAGTITALDATTHQVAATISVGGSPTAIVTGPYPPAVSRQTAFVVDMIIIAIIIIAMAATVTVSLTGTRRRTAKARL